MAAIASRRLRPDKPTVPVVSAGGVIVDEKGRVFLLRKSDERVWCFPKGHIEEGETARDAAAREIKEESGLTCSVGKQVADIRYAYYWPEEDVNYDKRVIYFLARYVGGDVQLEDRFDAGRWVSPTRALQMLHYRNDRTVLRKALTAAGLTGRS